MDPKLWKILKDFPAGPALAASMSTPAFEFNGLRRIAQSTSFGIPAFPTISWADFGYTKAKEKALFRQYYNELEATRVKALLLKRKGQGFSVVDMSMHAGAKDARSMGWCLSSMIMGIEGQRRTLEIIYRSTEIIKKHSADLWFIPEVLKRIEYEPTSIKFHLGYNYVSGVFLPTLFHWVEPVAFFEYLRKHDPQFFKFGSRFIRRSIRKENQTFAYSPEQHQHEYLWRMIPRSKILEVRSYLEEHE